MKKKKKTFKFTYLKVLTALRGLFEPALQVSELFADLVQHFVESTILRIVLVKLGFISPALLSRNNGSVSPETESHMGPTTI